MNPVAALLASNRVLLAPMAGVTEAPFRGICKRMGAGLTCTEMVSAKALHYNPDGSGSRSLLTLSPDEVPCAVQIFGADPQIMAEQARGIVERYGDAVALIDINMGCPVSKVVAKGEGSALMRTPELASAIVERVVAACGVPVTAKFRKGWNAQSANAEDFARALEAAGASAVTVHGRTREEFYHGSADWDAIAAVKRAVDIPVIGSGDVFCAGDVVAMLERTGVDAVMIARGAQGNPWIFREARALLDCGEVLAGPTACERIDMALEHAAELVTFAGDRAFVRMRKHVAWYISDMPDAARIRREVNLCDSFEQLAALLTGYRGDLERR